jgi:hypothetical protein
LITITKFVSSVWVIIIVTVRKRVRRLLTSIVTERGLGRQSDNKNEDQRTCLADSIYHEVVLTSQLNLMNPQEKWNALG